MCKAITNAPKKALLLKYREDVEQVDLFGMKREDYEEKKAACRTLVEELRALEKFDDKLKKYELSRTSFFLFFYLKRLTKSFLYVILLTE